MGQISKKERMDYDSLSRQDPVAAELARAEAARQASGFELIPSENYVSGAVLEALGTVFTNKYAEGYPHRRYYGGQEYTDQVEQLAIERAKTLFGCDHANVQPHSGAPANEAVYWSWCAPGDTILAMDLSHGGHLTHGHPATVLGGIFNFVRYGMADIETGAIDYSQVRDLALKHKPKIVLAGFSAYPRALDWAKFAEIAEEVGAVAMADIAHIAGLVAAGVSANPLEQGFHVATTTTHKTLRGPRGGLILANGHVTNPLKKPPRTLRNLPTLIDRSVFPGLQGGPHMHTILAKAVALGEAATDEFRVYAGQIVKNARALARALDAQGFKLVTGGTDNHLILVDVQASFGIDGAVAEAALDKIGLNVNKNVVPDDPNPAFRPSGIRLGTPAVTTRGLQEAEMATLAEWIAGAIGKRADATALAKLKSEVAELAANYPLPA